MQQCETTPLELARRGLDVLHARIEVGRYAPRGVATGRGQGAVVLGAPDRLELQTWDAMKAWPLMVAAGLQ